MSLISNISRRSNASTSSHEANASTSAPEAQQDLTVFIGESTPTGVPDLLSTTGSPSVQKARRAHRYNDNASSAPTFSSLQGPPKAKRVVSRGLKVSKITRTTNTRIRLAVQGEHRRPIYDTHKLFISFVGGIIGDDCPMLSKNWENVADVSKRSIVDSISADSQFSELDNYGDVYARAGNDVAISLHAEMLKKKSYLEEIASHTSDDSTPVPDRDAGLRIMTETLGVRRGREIRGMGAGRVRDLSAGTSSSQPSQPSSAEFVTLSNEVH